MKLFTDGPLGISLLGLHITPSSSALVVKCHCAGSHNNTVRVCNDIAEPYWITLAVDFKGAAFLVPSRNDSLTDVVDLDMGLPSVMTALLVQVTDFRVLPAVLSWKLEVLRLWLRLRSAQAGIYLREWIQLPQRLLLRYSIEVLADNSTLLVTLEATRKMALRLRHQLLLAH